MERGPQSGPREQAPAPPAGRTYSDGQYCFVAPRSPRSSSGVRRSSDRAPEPQPGALDATVAQRPEARSPAPAPLLGSPEYMAPEQARAEHDIDAQTDVWALCVLFYELVAGTTPFRRETSLATLAAIVSDEPECPDALRDEPELWCILRRGLVRERSERWGSARGLGRQLAVWAMGRGIEADAAGTSLASSWLGKRHTPLPPKPPQAEKRTVRAA